MSYLMVAAAPLCYGTVASLLTETIFTAVVASLTSDGASGREEGEIGRNDLTTTSPVQYLIDVSGRSMCVKCACV